MSEQAKVYERTENGTTTTHVSIREGLAEINHAMMAGKQDVREMSSINRTDYEIEYKDGRKVRLVRVDAPTEPSAETDERPDAWTVASHRTLLHRFTQADKDGRALCNKSFRPYRYGNGYDFKTKAEQQADKYAHLYTFCPRCEAK
jgi:hypothetical protein